MGVWELVFRLGFSLLCLGLAIHMDALADGPYRRKRA